MRLTNGERVTLIQRLRDSLENDLNWIDVDLVLTGFGLPSIDLDNVSNTYEARRRTQQILVDASDADLRAIAAHLFGDDRAKVEADLETAVTHLWLDGHIRVFISHLSEHERFAAEVVDELQKFGVDGFVAHKDIEPDEEWQREIELALSTCHVLVGILHEGFSTRSWTQQEVGWALGRGTPVLTVALEETPTGFKSARQASKVKLVSPVDVASRILVWLSRNNLHGRFVTEKLVESLANANNYFDARDAAQRLEDMGNLSPEILDKIEEAYLVNKQIHHSVLASPIVKRILLNHHREVPEIPR